MSRTLIDAVQHFVDDVGAALVTATDTDPEEARQQALRDAHDLVAGFVDADARHRDAEVRGYLTAVGPWIDPRLAEATVDEVRAAGLLSGARARLQEPGEVFDVLLAADARDQGRRAWTFKQRAMDLGHEVAALDLRASPGEVDAIGRFRRRCHAAIVAAGVSRPSQRRPAGGFFAGRADDAPRPGVDDAPRAGAGAIDDGSNAPRPADPEAVAAGDLAERTRTRHVDEILDELDELVGLEPVKAEVGLIADLLLVQRLREDRGLPTVPGARHLVFTGDRGTGRTTVARLVAEIYAGLGIVTNGHLVEISTDSLVDGGTTPDRIRDAVAQARGGVLLLEDPDALSATSDPAAAVAALDGLLEEHRRELVVILAGAPDALSGFLGAHDSLASRFPRTIHFPEYAPEELVAIAEHVAAAHGYRFDPSALDALTARVGPTAGSNGLGDARAVREVFETAVARRAARPTGDGPAGEARATITADDLDAALTREG